MLRPSGDMCGPETQESFKVRCTSLTLSAPVVQPCWFTGERLHCSLVGGRPARMGGQRGNSKKRKASNPGVGIDFKRVKHKVGKKLPKAQNETDTSFKARSINLPSQGLAEDKEGVATNSQNLTLKDLLNQTGHYNEKSRKHALVGLGDLFTRHPGELAAHVGAVYSRVVERMADSDEDVRKAAQQLLRSQMVPLIPSASMRPFMPMIMAHVCSAMTHLSLDIRNDALVFLDILMDHCPDLVISGYLGPCLQHFCDLLSAAHRSRSVKAQSIKATNKVLHALCGFLRRGFPDAGAVAGDMVGSISRVTTTSTTSTLQHHLTLAHSRCVWPARHTASGLDPVTAALLKSGLQAPATTPGAATHPPPHTAAAAAGSMAPPSGQGVVHSSALRLLHLLFECWMECSPAELGSPDPEKVTALVAILTAANKVVAGVLGGVKEAGSSIAGVETLVDGILKRVVPYFPAAMPVVRPSPAVLDLLTQYNLQASQLLVSFLPLHKAAAAAVPDGAHTSASGKRGQGRGSSSGSMLGSVQWVAALVSFYVGVLEQGVLVLPMDVLAERSALSPGAAGGTATPATKAEDTPADAAAAAASAAYTSVLQGVASAVTVVPPDIQHRVLQAVTDLSTRLHARATTRATCLKLQHTLMRAWQKGELELDPSLVVNWLGVLPKLLWELGGSAPQTSAIALAMLHDAARFTPAAYTEGEVGVVRQALTALQPQLAPLLALQIPAKQKQSKKRRGTEDQRQQESEGQAAAAAAEPAMTLLPGPLIKLPGSLQALAVDTVYHLPGGLDPALLKAAVRAVHAQLLAPSVSVRLVEVLMLRATSLEPALLGSLLFSLLFPPGTPSQQDAKQDSAVPTVPAAHAARVAESTLQRKCMSTVLRMVQGVISAGAALVLVSQPVQAEVQAAAAHPGSHQLPALHLFSLLSLACMALAEHHSQHRGALPLPEWLQHSIPVLCIQLAGFCVATPESGHAGVGSSDAVSLTADLLSVDPHLIVGLAQAAGSAAQQLCSQAGEAQSAQKVVAQFSGILSLVTASLRHASVHRLLLELSGGSQPQAAQALGMQEPLQQALLGLLSEDQLPAVIASDPGCMSELRRLRVLAQDVMPQLAQ